MLKSTGIQLRRLGVTRPTVVIAEPRARANIRRMAAKARACGVDFRPHFKTHQSAEIGRWFIDEGVTKITGSSLAMAEYFAGHGWNDITLAFLINPAELAALGDLARDLAGRGGSLGLTLDSVAVAGLLAAGDPIPARVWIKIDTGYGRTGVEWNQTAVLAAILAELGPAYAPAGLLSHTGHTYAARGAEQVTALWAEALGRLHAARRAMVEAGADPGLSLSLGDTPSCSLVADLGDLQEIRPGNFVFYDLMQWEIGSCAATDLAAAVVCPVVGVYPERRQLAIHGGAVHLSKESLARADGSRIYGLLGLLEPVGPGESPSPGPVLRQAPVVSLSQEHGIIEIDASEWEALTADLQIGDPVLVWPVHSCLACDLHREFMTLDGRRLQA